MFLEVGPETELRGCSLLGQVIDPRKGSGRGGQGRAGVSAGSVRRPVPSVDAWS